MDMNMASQFGLWLIVCLIPLIVLMWVLAGHIFARQEKDKATLLDLRRANARLVGRDMIPLSRRF